MIFSTKNKRSVFFRQFEWADAEALSYYLRGLGTETQKRFGPHPYTKEAIINFYSQQPCRGYIATDTITTGIVAYSIIKMGYLPHDAPRLQLAGITPDAETDCTFAPSVADEWQQCGIGYQMLQFIIADLQTKGIKRIILWGGVQKENIQALHFYQRNNFSITGQFNYQGENYDMIYNIPGK